MRRYVFGTACVLLICGSFGTASVAAAPAEQPPAASAARPADGESLALVHVINLHEIELAKLVMTRPLSQPTRALATMLQREHTQNEGEQAALGVRSQQTPAVATLQKQTQAETNKLRNLPPQAFEAAYIDAMVKGHTDAMELLDARAPVAYSAEVRQYLIQTRTAVASHLSEASKLQTGAVGK